LLLFVLRSFHLKSSVLDVVLYLLYYRHEAELQQAASQPLPDDDDDTFEWAGTVLEGLSVLLLCSYMLPLLPYALLCGIFNNIWQDMLISLMVGYWP